MKKLIFKIWFIAISLFLITNYIYAAYVNEYTTHFIINYQNDPQESNPVTRRFDYATPEYINNVRQIAEEIWDYVITKQGYRRPPNVPPDPIPDDRKIRIEVRDLAGSPYGATTVVGKDGTGIPRITIDNDYSGYNISGLNGLCITLIHEFFHAVQQSYANRVSFARSLLWFWDGTAAWIEDEPVTLAGVDIGTINSYILDNYAADYLNSPELSLDARIADEERYGVVLFFKYLAEKRSSAIIRQILENYDAGNYTRANSEDMLRAIGQALGDPSPEYFGDNFKRLFKDFTLACYMKAGPYGFRDEGAKYLPDVAHIIPIDDTNDYYIDKFDFSTGEISNENQLKQGITISLPMIYLAKNSKLSPPKLI